MSPGDVTTDAALVRRLLERQFPRWATLPLEPVTGGGTDNALYRLGDDLVARLPRGRRPAATLEKECRWLPRLAPHLPLPVPVPAATGSPAEGFPFRWAVFRWLPGEDATGDGIGDRSRFARDLASFVAALQSIDPAGGPEPGEHNFFRGVPLERRDRGTRAAIASLGPAIDGDVALAAWEDALGAPTWDRPPVWIHGDLDARNFLVEDGRLSGVVDFGGLALGDPACDAMAGWKVLREPERAVFRTALSVDDATWARARGWALSQSLVALAAYTPETQPALVREARHWLAEVLAEPGAAG